MTIKGHFGSRANSDPSGAVPSIQTSFSRETTILCQKSYTPLRISCISIIFVLYFYHICVAFSRETTILCQKSYTPLRISCISIIFVLYFFCQPTKILSLSDMQKISGVQNCPDIIIICFFVFSTFVFFLLPWQLYAYPWSVTDLLGQWVLPL